MDEIPKIYEEIKLNLTDVDWMMKDEIINSKNLGHR